MKIIASLTILNLAVLSYGQTNIISLRSSSGEMDKLYDQDDNFGIHPGMDLQNVDSVRYIPSKKMVIEYKRSYFTEKIISDTINYQTESKEDIQEHLKAIRLNHWYPKKTKFIGFPKDIEKMATQPNKVFKNAISFWATLLISALAFGKINGNKRN